MINKPLAVIEGTVIKGLQQARLLGTPTANVRTDNCIAEGVYLALTDVPRLNLVSVLSMAYLKDQILESYLIDKKLDLYDQLIIIRLYKFIRPPLPFISMEQMALQIQEDLSAVLEVKHLLGCVN